MQEDIFGFLLIIWSQVLTIVFVFYHVIVVIITILRALVLGPDVKPENNF